MKRNDRNKKSAGMLMYAVIFMAVGGVVLW